MMKSLHSIGTSTAARTAARSSKRPPNLRCSVSTEMIRAPPASYSLASAAGSVIAASAPLAGLRRLTSAITLTRPERNAANPSLASGRRLTRAFKSASGTCCCRISRSARTPSRISSSTLTPTGSNLTVSDRRGHPSSQHRRAVPADRPSPGPAGPAPRGLPRRSGQPDRERGATLRCWSGVRAPAEPLGQPGDQSQPDPGADPPDTAVALIERGPLERDREVVRGEPRTAVTHLYHRFGPVGARCQHDRRSRRSHPQRVLGQPVHDLTHPGWVGVHP